MKKKSKFLVVLLSPVPGLSHLYLGRSQRAFMFFAMFLGLIMVAAMGSEILPVNDGFIGGISVLAMGLLWFLALAEALSLASRLADGSEQESNDRSLETDLQFVSSRKMLAIAFSIFPGAGHMYLGLLRQGAQIMAAFFLTLCLVSFLGLRVFIFVLPVIFFYSLFDVCHLLDEESDGLRPDTSLIFDWFSDHPHWLGWGLIILGLLVMVQRVINPALVYMISPEMKNYIETCLVAVLLIGGGIKLLIGGKADLDNEDGDDQ
ncbi:MAG: hypothetical protein GXY34_11780 [Syntrophomonadaceae bacterium]|nr:hypothetical protein [Syntrophomonadaceae bacterium]